MMRTPVAVHASRAPTHQPLPPLPLIPRILAKTAETFVFVYIGASMFLLGTDWHEFMLFLATLVLINIARCMHVYPGVAAINAVRAKERAIPSTHKHMLALSGNTRTRSPATCVSHPPRGETE